MPSLLFAGELDGAIDADRFDASKGAFSGAYELHTVKGSGHFPQLEKTDEVANALVEFLNLHAVTGQ